MPDGPVLQVADSPTDLAVHRISSPLPEPSCDRIVKGDECCDATHTAFPEVVLASANQGKANALASILLENREPIHVPAPSVPPSYQCANEFSFLFGNQECPRRFGAEESLDVIEPIGSARMLATALHP